MPAVQTVYSENIGKAYAGMIADMTLADVVTGLSEEATLGFGLPVSQGTADKGVTLGGSAFKGVTVRDVTLRPSSEDLYLETENVGVLRHGEIWVTVAEAVDAGDPVYYDTTTGAWYKQAGGGRVQVTGAKWTTSAASGLAKAHFVG